MPGLHTCRLPHMEQFEQGSAQPRGGDASDLAGSGCCTYARGTGCLSAAPPNDHDVMPNTAVATKLPGTAPMTERTKPPVGLEGSASRAVD